MFESPHHVVAAGIRLNAVALNYGRDHLLESILERDAMYQLCFLDPDGASCRQREDEEDIELGTLKTLTSLNLRHMEMLRQYICARAPEACTRLQIYTYDLPPR